MIKGKSNFDRFAEAIKKSPDKLKRIVADEAKKSALSFEQERQKSFDKGRSPYDVKWPKRKDPKQKHPLLNKSGRLKRGFKARASGPSIGFSNQVPYAGFHDKGTSALPVRQLLPSAKQGLPRKWSVSLSRRINARIKKELI